MYWSKPTKVPVLRMWSQSWNEMKAVYTIGNSPTIANRMKNGEM